MQGPVTVDAAGRPMGGPGHAAKMFERHPHSNGEIYAIYDNAQVRTFGGFWAASCDLAKDGWMNKG